MRCARVAVIAVVCACLGALGGGCGVTNRYRVVAEWRLLQTYRYVVPNKLHATGNDVFVLTSQWYVIQFDRDGGVKRQWGWEQLKTPADFTFDKKGDVFVADAWHRQVLKFTRNGKLLGRLGGPGDGPGMFRSPGNVVALPDGGVLAYDAHNKSLTRFDADGRLADYRSTELWSMDADSDGNLYVIGIPPRNIQKMTPDGRVLKTWGRKGKKPGEFSATPNVSVGQDGKVYVADLGNMRVQIFDRNGKLLTMFGKEVVPGRDFLPKSVTVDKKGYIYVINDADHRILKIEPPELAR